MVASCPSGRGLVSRSVLVRTDQVAWLRYVLEAHEGLGLMHSDGSGAITLMAPESLAAELDALIEDLRLEGVLSTPLET